MGGEAYWYFVKYQPNLQPNLQTALNELREREFQAGRYNPVMPFLDFPINPDSSAPGAQHGSIEEAMADAEEDGTRSILDIATVGESPDFCVAAPVPSNVLESLLGTAQPTREVLEENLGEIIEDVDRGHCIYTVVYKNGAPDEILFAGYSFD